MAKCVFCIAIIFLTLTVSAQNTKEDTIAKPPALADRYNILISKAATAVANENFDEAKALYNEALSLKPNDPVVTGMLVTVNNSIKALEVIQLRNADLKRKADINILLKQAQSEVAAKNYDSAKLHYEQVLTLSPIKSQEEFVKQRIRAIDFASTNSGKSSSKPVSPIRTDSTTGIVKKEPGNVNTRVAGEFSFEPSKKVVKGEKDSIVSTTKMTSQHIDSSRKAREIERKVAQISPNINPVAITKEPAKAEAKSSSNNADNKNNDLARQAPAAERQEAVFSNKAKKDVLEAYNTDKQKPDPETAGKAKIDSLIENAIKAINRENWQTALDLYSEVLTLNPTAAQRSAISSEISSIKRNIDKAKLKSRGSNVSTTISPVIKNTPALSNETSVSKPATSKSSDTGLSVSARKDIAATSVNKPISIINMPSAASQSDTPSISQSSAVAMKDIDREDIEFSKKMIAQPGLVRLTDSNRQVKLICQGITTNGKNTFIKFLIKNEREDSEFNIGSLQMMHIQNSGKLKKLDLRYISDADVVLPKKEIPLIVVTENPSAIDRNEVFVFEMEDQSQNTKLTVNISADNFPGKNNQGKAF